MPEIHRRDFSQQQISFLRERHQHTPVVARINRPSQKPKSHHAPHKFNRGVMLDQQESGKLTDKHRSLAGKPLDGEERLILLGGQADVPGVGVGEFQENSQAITELGKGLVVDGSNSSSCRAASRSPPPAAFLALAVSCPGPTPVNSRLGKILSHRERNDDIPELSAGRRHGVTKIIHPIINIRSIFWSATGIRVFRRRVEVSSASATSAFEISPVEHFARMSCHMAESDFPA